jgi:glycosyltransferase involved in cell wall biosynthesis
VRALYFGTYDRKHPRNVNAIAAMSTAGVEVTERWARVRRGGPLGALSVFAAETRLARPRRDDFDVVIVGYPGHFDVPRARRIARKRPLVFDAVLSLEDELVGVRRRFRPRSTAATVLRAVDSRALRLPDLVVCGTRAEAAYLEQLGARRTAVIFLGADEDVFCETWSPAYPFSALYVADASHDLVAAAALLVPELPVQIVEPDRAREGERGLAFAHAGIVLGSFRESRAIPPAVFEALATGAPVITADTPAARELLVDGASALLVEPGNAAALADALRRLTHGEELRAAIAARGQRVYAERASRRALGALWRNALDGNALDGNALRE